MYMSRRNKVIMDSVSVFSLSNLLAFMPSSSRSEPFSGRDIT